MSPCIEWTKCKNKKGYGKTRYNGKYMYAHRMSWVIKNGEIPDRICVLHKCDNPSCYNVEHLFLGTKAENNSDMDNKKRRALGEKLNCSHLKSEDVVKIKNMISEGKRQKDIASLYFVSRSAIAQISAGINWRHV